MGTNTKVKLEGASAYKNDLKQIAAEAKLLAAEMKAVQSSFTSSTSAQEKNEKTTSQLNSQIEKQKQLIQTLDDAINAETNSENSNAATLTKLKTQRAEAQASLNQMENAVEDVGDAEDDTGKKTSNFGDILKASLAHDVIVGGLKMIGNAIKEVATAAVDMGKQVVSNYADYEQLSGGVSKLFGDAATVVEKNAANAFKTAGLSANEYMETVTGFSASLIQSVGGDTVEAARLADVAIRDMSDNANTFGSDIDSIQNAYGGFAKGTFTMLDNLKLGYGGTKEEMQRLLDDANAYNAQQGINTQYQIDNYADIVNAIHDIQTAQNIEGTTAAEAAGTVSGSIDTMKSAYANFLTELGKTDGDISGVSDALITSFENVVQNIIPIVQNIVDQLPAVFEQVAPAIEGILPILLDTVSSMFPQILTTITGLLPTLIPAATEALTQIGTALIENLPILIDNLPLLISGLVDGIIALASSLLVVGVDLVTELWNGINENGSIMLDNLKTFVDDNIIQPIKNKFNEMIDAGKNLVEGLWNGISDKLAWMKSRISEWVDNVLDFFKNLLKIGSPSKVFEEYGKYIVQGLAIGLNENAKLAENAMQGVSNRLTGIDYGFNAPTSNGITASGGRIVNLVINTNSLDEGMVDYVVTQVNRRLGEAI